MKVEALKESGLTREYKVTVDAAAITQASEAKLKAMSAKVKIPGFRPGHVPMNVMQQRYGKNVLGEAIEQAVQNASRDLIKSKNLKPALKPKIEVTDYQDGGDLEFTMSVENLPDIAEYDFSKVSLEKLTYDVEDSEIDTALTRIREANKSFTPREDASAAEKGDVVLMDFTGKKNGVEFPGGAAKNFRLTLGSGQFIPGFEDQLVGVKKGQEKTLNLEFPKDYHKEDLAGQPVTFDVKVHDILQARTPEADDAFGKQLGFDDAEKLRTAVREQLDKEYGGVQRQKLKKSLFDHLEEHHRFDVPQGMLDLEFNSIWDRLQEAKKGGDPSLDRPEDELKDEYKRIAERRVRLGLILADIGQKQKLDVTREELTKAVLEQARQFPGQEQKVFEFYQKNPANMEDLRGPILEDKAVDYLLTQVKTTERKVTLDELMKEDDEDSAPQAKKTNKKKTTS